ncbi:aminoglycoside N(3)-acetyltransferase [Swingsia samuiensis]|uniref:Aminoglycoside N(3)-acetyltransferase n=1 Tax=Swingsia samuiensis TaxID=1293412 RepID=A0A4Y6UGJ8_9PROT|nr:AAC(3) family N-acetyltransferase [Swingsia samuiensis]QDH16673.1 AAC(3) family N-acetyltransferase [Swingsia samuiensis]
MTEAAAIARSSEPITKERLLTDFRKIGLSTGQIVLVHASMSRMGWVCGGARTVIESLLEAIGPKGTLVMPAQSFEYSDPASWYDPTLPEDWWDTIRNNIPAFDPHLSPTRNMGIIAETFRLWPHTLRSNHPQASFTAQGPEAAHILAHHPLEDPFGLTSPLGKLYKLNASILMIGTHWDTCTGLHLAERIAYPEQDNFEDATAMLIDGQRKWVHFKMPRTNKECFSLLGTKLDQQTFIRHGHIGYAPTRLVSMPAAIDMAAGML